MLREWRQARYGHLLAAHILPLRADVKNPALIAEFLLFSRSSVYRTVKAYNAGRLDWQRDQDSAPSLSRWQKKLRSMIQQPPRLFGRWRMRWNCAVLALIISVLCYAGLSRETI
jgi:hypothetical protein